MPFRALDRISRIATRRGIFGDSNVWAAIAVLTWLLRLVRKANAPKTVGKLKLEPGDRFVISSRLDP